MHVNYIGTLRDECYSNEMLDIMYECLNKNKNIHFYLIIGKIHKGVKYFLIERLKQLNNCFVGYNFNDDDISKIYKISHVSLSIWKTENEQNQHLLSSKMILGYLYDNIVLYLKPNTISDMQKHSSIGMNNINELSTNLNDIYNTLKQTKTIKMCRNVIINYSFDYNIFSLKQLIQSPCNFDFVHIFNISFDYIYGLYINDKELNHLQNIKSTFNIDIQVFKGVDGNKTLQKEYHKYLARPLETEFEEKSGVKRLTIGAMGHLYSFIKIVKDAKKNNYEKILILESDIFPHLNIFEEFAKKIQILENYKILYLGGGMWEKIITFKNGLYIPNKTTGTFAISFDISIYDELIKEWEKIINPTDVCLWDI